MLSRDRDVDPVGACVGIRGSRIQNIVQELHGERIDIVVWSQDIASYARNALAPATISRIVVDEDENLLEVIVPDDQLTNAIGRKGQNVKLAAKLLGWKIDIFTESRHQELHAIGRGLEQLAAVAEIPLEAFTEAGFNSLELIAEASDEDLIKAVAGLTPAKLSDLRTAANFLGAQVSKVADADSADADSADADSADADSADALAEEREGEAGETGSEAGDQAQASEEDK